MDGLDYWCLCDELSVNQAALLILGIDPAPVQRYIQDWAPDKRPDGYDAAMAALTHAVLADRLKATIRRSAHLKGVVVDSFDIEDDETTGIDQVGREVIYVPDPDWNLTTVAVEELKKWLRSRGIKTGFFFPCGTGTADYLDPNNPRYSPKLAAAIGAWEAVSRDTSLTRGRTVKQAIVTWLRRYANQFDLTKDDGNPNGQGIEEVSKIANWDTKGGAPKTPGE